MNLQKNTSEFRQWLVLRHALNGATPALSQLPAAAMGERPRACRGPDAGALRTQWGRPFRTGPGAPQTGGLSAYWIVPTDQKKVSPEESATPSLSVIT